MATFQKAFDVLMTFEDSHLEGKITTDEGGKTRWGIASKYHPDLLSEESDFFDEDNHDGSLETAEQIIRDEYWNRFRGDEIESEDVAAKLLNISVNCGNSTGLLMAQRACNGADVEPKIAEDGKFGDKTLAAINSIDEIKLMKALRVLQLAHYEHIESVRRVPENEKKSWARRAVA